MPKVIDVRPPRLEAVRFLCRGTSQYVCNKMGPTALGKMIAEQEDPTLRGRKQREPRDFERDFQEATRRAPEGWCGVPANGLASALVDACRTTGVAMTLAKQAFRVLADGYDAEDGMPLVRITKGEPSMFIAPVPNSNGKCDLRSRPRWLPGWEIEPRIEWDANVFNVNQVSDLLMHAGISCGIGPGRPTSKKSKGCGWGLWTVVKTLPMSKEPVATAARRRRARS